MNRDLATRSISAVETPLYEANGDSKGVSSEPFEYLSLLQGKEQGVFILDLSQALILIRRFVEDHWYADRNRERRPIHKEHG